MAADSSIDNPDLVEDVTLPPDLPLEMIAEEVKNSWRLKVGALAILRCSIPGKGRSLDRKCCPAFCYAVGATRSHQGSCNEGGTPHFVGCVAQQNTPHRPATAPAVAVALRMRPCQQRHGWPAAQ